MSGGEVIPAPSFGLVEFSYGDLTCEAAIVARDAAANIRSAREAFLPEVGRHLLRARGVMEHGTFTRWAQAELDMSDRTVRNYMQAARFCEGKPETIAVLPPTLLYALSAPTAAKEVVQSVVAAAQAGETLDARAINTRLDTAKQEALELKTAQRRNPKVTQADLKARKEQRRSRLAAEDERRVDEEAKAKQEREDQVRPLAAAIATLGDDRVAELLDVLFRWNDVRALADVLRKTEP